ncbi:MAG: hypothetical protein ACQXXJ_04580 [Candidatus Bathyarchaeia archaeon]
MKSAEDGFTLSTAWRKHPQIPLFLLLESNFGFMSFYFMANQVSISGARAIDFKEAKSK